MKLMEVLVERFFGKERRVIRMRLVIRMHGLCYLNGWLKS